MPNVAELRINGKSLELPIVVGSEGEKAIDIRQLRAQTGYVTLDQGFMNTGSVTSNIAFIDGDAGILHYRGIPIEELAEKSSFVEVSYLLIYGKLPNADELARFSSLLTLKSALHEDMRHFFDRYPITAHPMAILSAMVAALSSYYPDSLDVDNIQKMLPALDMYYRLNRMIERFGQLDVRFAELRRSEKNLASPGEKPR